MAQEIGAQSQVESYQRLKKMACDATLLSTQHYKVRTKGKMKQYRERSNAFLLHHNVVAIEKEAFESPLTMIANFTYPPTSHRLNSNTAILLQG